MSKSDFDRLKTQIDNSLQAILATVVEQDSN
jgi:hypothetical protein